MKKRNGDRRAARGTRRLALRDRIQATSDHRPGLLLAIAACAIVGVAGLLLPLIPGLLFLAIAAVLLRQFQRRQIRM